jgi:hypothetical protein
MDEDLARIEQQKETAHYRREDHPDDTGPWCPACGSPDVSDRDAVARDRAGGIEEPPWRYVCEDCGEKWESDE